MPKRCAHIASTESTEFLDVTNQGGCVELICKMSFFRGNCQKPKFCSKVY